MEQRVPIREVIGSDRRDVQHHQEIVTWLQRVPRRGRRSLVRGWNRHGQSTL
jgi:hypothetical protein